MDAAKIGVFKKSHKICFRSFLKSNQRRCLESEIIVKAMSNFSDKSLEWKFSEKEFSSLLISSDLSESNCSRSESVWSFDTSFGWGGFSSCFSSKSFLGGFCTGGFSSGLFSSGHCFVKMFLVIYIIVFKG